MRPSTFIVMYSLLLKIVLTSSNTINKRAASRGSFQLFAYGDSIGGLPVFSTGSAVYIGDPTLLNSTEAAPVIFTQSSTSLLSNPNTTAVASSAPTWSNLTFAIPPPTSSSHNVTLVSTNQTANQITTGFTFYGHFFMVEEDGGFQSVFYALPTEVEGVWSLNWNTTGDDTAGKVPATLRDVRPSNTNGNVSVV